MSAAALRRTGRALRASTQLGWIISSNWTSPGIFLVYALLKPMSAALILTVMYRVIAGDSPQTRTYLAFLVVGAAFWSFVQGSMSGFANAISEDRGRYRQLKYVYMSPQPFSVYLVGRGAAQLLSALVSVVLVLAIATPLLHLPLTITDVDWPLLLAACVLAFATVLALGMAVSVLLLGARDSYGYGEIIASTCTSSAVRSSPSVCCRDRSPRSRRGSPSRTGSSSCAARCCTTLQRRCSTAWAPARCSSSSRRPPRS